MKKILLLVFMLCFCIPFFVGCGDQAKADPTKTVITSYERDQIELLSNSPDPEKIFTLQIAHAQPESNPRHISLLAFKKMVEERTTGHVVVEIFPTGQLGTETEMLKAVKEGTIQGFRGGQLEPVPKLLIFTLPFLCDNYTQVNALLHSDLAADFSKDPKDDRILILGLGNGGGFRQFSNNQRLIKNPTDLIGLRMRTNGMETVVRTLKVLGADTVWISYSDLYLNLKSRIVDGQDNSAINAEGMKFYEVQKYFTMVNYQFHPDPFYVNSEWYNSLPAEYQIVLKECTTEMMKINDNAIQNNEAAAMEVIENNAEVYYPTPEEIEVFKEAVQPVYDAYLKEGKVTQEELDRIREIIAEAK